MSLAKQSIHRIVGAALFLPLIVVLVFSGKTAATQQSVPQQAACEDADSRLLSLLDDCVQQRFKDIDKGFGYRRMITPGDTPHRFKPENAKELKVVDELKTSGLNVVLYVAGRFVLGDKPPGAEPQPMFSRRLIKGPASVTPGDQKNVDLPLPAQLWDQSREAMLEFQTAGDRYTFAVGNWKFSARPVRATEQSCLDCHRAGVTLYANPLRFRSETPEDQQTRPLRIGDPLGVVLYAYERQTK